MARAAHLILVGLPGAGKSTVGRLLASALQWPFVDLDERIAERAKMSVREIFATHGEAAFRAFERDVTLDLAAADTPMVIAPGGGWITVPGMIDAVRPPSRLIWLRVAPARAIERLGTEVSTRPLLAGENPLASLTAILAVREAFYLQSDHTVSVDSMAPREVVDAILPLARP